MSVGQREPLNAFVSALYACHCRHRTLNRRLTFQVYRHEEEYFRAASERRASDCVSWLA